MCCGTRLFPRHNSNASAKCNWRASGRKKTNCSRALAAPCGRPCLGTKPTGWMRRAPSRLAKSSTPPTPKTSTDDWLGLAYYVGAQNFVGLAPGYFAFYVGTAPEKAGLVEKELLAEADLLRRDGLTEEELKRAKAKVIGQKKIARQDLGGFAMATSLDELYGLGYNHYDQEDALYEAVTLEDVKRMAQKYLLSNACAVSIVQP